MLYEEFKIKIEKFSTDLVNIIASEKDTLENIQTEHINILLANKENTIKILQDLEVEYATSSDKKQKQINILNHKISQLKEELSNEINAFQIQHNLQPLKTSLMNSKDDKLSGLKQVKKKEINDLNSKINALDKECLLILKEKDNAISETEKNHKAKIAELERRMKLEVVKINESILAPVPNNVGKGEQELEESTFSKQRIKEIRKNGVNEIANVKLQYLNTIYKTKLAFQKILLQNEHDSQITREDYNLKIAEIKYIREKHKRELQKALDDYDFESYIILNDTSRDKHLEEKNIVNEYYQRMYQHSDTINRIEVKRNVTNEKITSQFLNKVNDSDLVQAHKFNEFVRTNIDSLNKNINYYHQYLNDFISLFSQTVISNINDFWDSYYNDEKHFISSLIMMNYQASELRLVTFANSINQMDELRIKYKKMQEARFKKLVNTIENNIKLILNQFKIYINAIIEYANEELNATKVYYNDYSKIINATFITNKDIYDQENANNHRKVSQMIENKTALHKNELENLKSEIDQINQNHLNEYNDILLKKKNHDLHFDEKEKQILKEHHEYLASVKKNIEAIDKKFKDDFKAFQKMLTKENAKEIKEIEIERKTKLQIGQI